MAPQPSSECQNATVPWLIPRDRTGHHGVGLEAIAGPEPSDVLQQCLGFAQAQCVSFFLRHGASLVGFDWPADQNWDRTAGLGPIIRIRGMGGIADATRQFPLFAALAARPCITVFHR